MERNYCPRFVRELKPQEVFVFPSNEKGFHGAGAAGFAMRGTTRNNWRGDSKFLRAMRSKLEDPARVGRWAIYGIGRGYQEGNSGNSYAIATITRPGHKRSIPLSRILQQFKELGEFARKNSSKTFLVVISGGGYSGWSVKDLQEVYRRWCETEPPPKNILLKREYEFRKN